jgi:hypothetical protein
MAMYTAVATGVNESAANGASMMRRLLLPLVLLAGCAHVHQYPPALVKNFMNACRERGAQQAYCDCCLATLQRDVPVDEFRKMEVRIAVGQPWPEELIGAVASCREPR